MSNNNKTSFLLGQAALLVWGSVDSTQTDVDALNDWWTNEHLPERLSIPGFRRARRYVSQNDSAQSTKYMTFYEAAGLDTLTSESYMEKLDNPTQGTKQHIPTLATMQRAACEVVHSECRDELRTCRISVGGTVAMVTFSLPPDDEWGDEVQQLLSWAFKKMQRSERNAMALHLFREDGAATAPGSRSQSYIKGNLVRNENAESVRWMAFFEFSTPSKFLRGGSELLEPVVDELSNKFGGHSGVDFGLYDLMCSAAQTDTSLSPAFLR